jgi:glucokinase
MKVTIMYYIGVDLGGTKIAVGLVNPEGQIVYQDSMPTGREREYQEIIKDMAYLTTKVIKDARVNLSDIKGIGIGSPGTPDNDRGLIVYNNNLRFRNVPIRAEMQKYIELPVFIENDANCAALAENVAGAAKGVEHSVTITIGTGIGAGIVINGQIYSGFNFAASEIGHTVIVVDGEPCSCGRKGCWEVYASATGLIRQARAAAKENPESYINRLVNDELSRINAKIPFDAAKKGDAVALKVVERYEKYLATGLINVINALQPEILVIGGGVCHEGEYLLKPLREMIEGELYSKDIPQTQMKVAQLGNEAGIVGAAFLCR